MITLVALFLIVNYANADFPELPMTFYGNATVDNQAIPIGSKIRVTANGVIVGEIKIVSAGIYGTTTPMGPNLSVGNFSENELLFYYIAPSEITPAVNYKPYLYSVSFQSGEVIKQNISFNKIIIGTINSGSGGGGSFVQPEIKKEIEIIIEEDLNEIQEEENVVVLGLEYEIKNDVEKIIEETLAREKEKFGELDTKLVSRLKGKILLQVEEHGEAWYVNPKNSKKYYMANGYWAFQVMRFLSIGVTNKDLEKIKSDNNFAKKHSGKIFIQVESDGEAFYIDFNGNNHYLKDGDAAYDIMRNLGLGISNENIRKIEVGEIN